MSEQKRITSFQPIVDANAKVLILGTMPSIKSLLYQEYYGNRQNAFWKILFCLFEQEFSEVYSDRVALIQEHGIALWDVLQSCERKSSLDSDIQEEKANDIQGLLQQYPNINTVVFSSQKAALYFKKHIGSIAGIELLTLASPSGANACMSLSEKIADWQQLKTKL
ncbi:MULTISPECIES: DNA-deoxyinosine glycosylase [Myroides]|uniref:DNA-deoxyinosine glycosylase n=1 Tax=Myroides odoratimimus TaxID=76832 RepID=A0AAI8C4X0_9FLAO|nr:MULTISPECIES: DNA-deoxyinosine glycosylase [Myroides]AJA69445.1 G/U mismatch-specific uracil-DNA glycosylase [Myroides sp. A21]ALU26703.1 DNA-deoxyinosine glycosylase [Myroides odoratimimus]APA92718.1 DNA-deoxyinosine glycosylase [Myroides sp. ZB35]EHO12820.1 hypothetical protein HMPREF9714_01190 [Myroides odoratimimus CCUG 12901]MCO7724085.1 DNA-deoxyinosine glycosylase [Myroides odoratimimus]